MPNQIDKMNKLKRSILQTSFRAGEGHLGSDFSILDILWVLYNDVLSVNPKQPDDPKRDRFFLSKGQASLALYVVLAEKGFFSKELLKNYCEFEAVLGGHLDRNKIPGVEASTGSLGHGFPMAVGASLGLKIKDSKERVFVLIGDGEANEGTVWESALLSAHHKGQHGRRQCLLRITSWIISTSFSITIIQQIGLLK